MLRLWICNIKLRIPFSSLHPLLPLPSRPSTPFCRSPLVPPPPSATTNLWTVFKILCHFQWLIHFSSEINFRKAKAFVKIIDSSIFLHIMTRTMIQTKCGDLHEVEVLKVMKTPKGFECRNRPGRTANYRRRRNQLIYMVHEVKL